jgi:hypothetical protein
MTDTVEAASSRAVTNPQIKTSRPMLPPLEIRSMRKQSHLIAAILLISGCGTNSVPQGPLNDQHKQTPQAGLSFGDDADEQHQLPFKIMRIYERQKSTVNAPYHVDGGEWTFFDCLALSDPTVSFTVGVSARSDGGGPSAWGKANLIVKDREAGARFVELFSKVFSGKLPKPVKRAHAPVPLSINTAILGQNINRARGGGFSVAAGGWTATKWFPERDGFEGEVFFNYNLAERQGEFGEKDADYADDLVAIFASALRDGPRPERTPENDPNLTRTGPTIGKPRKLLSRLASHYSFSPKGHFAVYQDRSTVLALPIDAHDREPLEVIRFDHSPWEIHVLSEDLDLIAQEGIPELPGVKSSGDPMRIWWVDGKTKQKTLLQGPQKELNLAEAPVSPDHQLVALTQWRQNPGGKGRTKILRICNRQSGDVKVIEFRGKDFSIVGWRKTEAVPRALAVTNRWQFGKKEPSELYLADPSTGQVELQGDVDARLEIDDPLSSDGKHRVRVGKDELIVTDLADGKQHQFVFHQDDRRFVGSDCVQWVSPWYLKFNGQRLALIDVTMMKMCFPASADGVKLGSAAYRFSPDLHWVLYQGEGIDGEGLYLAPVKMPN